MVCVKDISTLRYMYIKAALGCSLINSDKHINSFIETDL